MNDVYMGEIRPFCFAFAPDGWAFCNGSAMPVPQNQALYSIIANIYGGDRTSFNLPDLVGRAPMGYGRGVEITALPGQKMGYEQWPLAINEMPNHSHNLLPAYSLNYPDTTGVTAVPTAGASFDIIQSGPDHAEGDIFNNTAAPTVLLSSQALASTGNGQAHENRQPYLALNFCICIAPGEYPTRG